MGDLAKFVAGPYKNINGEVRGVGLRFVTNTRRRFQRPQDWKTSGESGRAAGGCLDDETRLDQVWRDERDSSPFASQPNRWL